MSLLRVLYRVEPGSTQMQRITLAANSILCVGLMLLATLSLFELHLRFTITPWIIPTLFLVYLCALILVHVARTHGRGEDGKGRGIEAETGQTPKQQAADGFDSGGVT